MSQDYSSRRQAIAVTLAACLLTGLLVLFFNASKHDPVLSRIDVFTEDPYDAVGSFGVQLAALASLLSLARLFRPNSSPGPSGQAVLRSSLVALLSGMVTYACDGVALIRFHSQWTSSSAGWFLAFAVSLLLTLHLLATGMVVRAGHAIDLSTGGRHRGGSLAICMAGLAILAFYPPSWRTIVPGAIATALVGTVMLFVLTSALARATFPDAAPDSADLIDDASAYHQWLKSRFPFAGLLFRWLDTVASFRWVRVMAGELNPRIHPWRLPALVGVLMGIALIIAEALGEGPPGRSVFILVLAVFIGLESAGVLLGYALFRRYLGLFRS